MKKSFIAARRRDQSRNALGSCCAFRASEQQKAKAIVCAHLIMGGQKLKFGKDKELERLTGVALDALLGK